MALCGVLVTCARPDSISWTELDYQELLRDMENPSGEVTSEAVLETAEKFRDNADAIFLLGSILNQMFPAGVEDFAEDGTTLAPDPGAPSRLRLPAGVVAAEGDVPNLEGTNVFVKLACWGPDADEPDLSFRYGFIRVDSPGLSEEVIENLGVAGDFLISFRGCEFPDGVLTGVNPGFYDEDESGEGIIALRFNTVIADEGGFTSFIDEPLLIRNGVFSVLYRLEDGSGTIRVDVSSDYATFVVTGTNGAWTCTTDTGELVCLELF